eukprot:6480496-Amphidinium_carterae.1
MTQRGGRAIDQSRVETRKDMNPRTILLVAMNLEMLQLLNARWGRILLDEARRSDTPVVAGLA